MSKCGQRCEVYSRVMGYMRPVSNWNKGKQQEFKDRKNYELRITNYELGKGGRR